jgi:hypothetical protein
MRAGLFSPIMAALLAALPVLRATGEETGPVSWLSAEGAHQQLERPLSVQWSGVRLQDALNHLARSQRVAILLDRRVDPDQEIELTLENVRLETALATIAARLNLGVSQVGPVVYLGPPKTARRLRTLVELRNQEIESLPAAIRRVLLTRKPCRWEMLATPREVLEAASKDYGIKLEHLEQMPHDLWRAADLPTLTFAERMSLIAAQFDLTFTLHSSGRTLQLIAMPEQPSLEKAYPATAPAEAVSKLRPLLPNCELKAEDRRIFVRGTAEDHEAVRQLLAGKTVRRVAAGPSKTVYQLNVSAPAGRLIRELATKLGRRLEIDEEAIRQAGLSLEKDVKVSVRNVNEEDLLRALLDPAGLTFERKGESIIVRPK